MTPPPETPPHRPMPAQQFPRPMPGESDEAYRGRLRAWCDAIPSDNTPGFQRAEWEYLCSLAGVAPE